MTVRILALALVLVLGALYFPCTTDDLALEMRMEAFGCDRSLALED
jgi:hypothetical protein